jgi:hypothetical protein
LAGLAKDPKGWELEDFVAAHFVSRGCYVETGVKERSPDEILELDLFWTDYRKEPQERISEGESYSKDFDEALQMVPRLRRNATPWRKHYLAEVRAQAASLAL